jgi:hypothetical protein
LIKDWDWNRDIGLVQSADMDNRLDMVKPVEKAPQAD